MKPPTAPAGIERDRVSAPASGDRRPRAPSSLMNFPGYDPMPAALTSVNADLRLTPELARRHDYERLPPRVRCPVWVMAGGLEPWRWVENSLRYAQHLRRHGIDSELVVAPGFHHFDIIDQYADEGSLLTGCLSRLV